MPQQSRNQPEQIVHKQLTQEQARDLARKSHQALKAQREKNLPEVRVQGRSNQPPMPPQQARHSQPTPTRSPQQGSVYHGRQQAQQPPMPEEDHVTRDGTPDRRYIENRALPPPAHKSGEFVGIHLTRDGKPDRRYIENQHLSDRDAEIEKAKALLRQNGIRVID